MRLKKNLFILTFCSLLLAGCGEDISKREYLDIQYLNYETLNELGNYANDDIGNDTNDKIAESAKDTEKFIRWTAAVIEVKSNKKLILQEEELPEIEIELSTKIDEGSIKKGDIITVSGTLNKYVHGLFGTTPKWIVKDGAVIETTDKAKAELLSFQEAILDKKNQIAESEKQKDIAKKEEEAKVAEEAEAQEQERKQKAKSVFNEQFKGFVESSNYQYERIWNDFWVTTASGNLSNLEAYQNMRSLEKVYKYHRLETMDFSNDVFADNEEKLIKEYIKNIKLAYQNREDIGSYAKKFFDKEKVSPSEIDKFNRRTQDLSDKSEEYYLKAEESFLELEKLIGSY